MSGGRQKVTAAGAALIATAALIGAGCTASSGGCQLGAHALAVGGGSSGGTGVKKPPPKKGAAPSARARTGSGTHHDDDCDDW
ncbi:hypothetical protein [Streptomyces althioticus]|uniref:hypothetical protein n=1 Tax=Streptomyces althioticus TaxID=83380 RepID=UPI00342DA47F